MTGTATSDEYMNVAGVSIRGTNTGCSNSGTIKVKGMVGDRDYPIFAAGVSVAPEKISSCYNTGKVTVENLTNGDVFAAGVAARPESDRCICGCLCGSKEEQRLVRKQSAKR